MLFNYLKNMLTLSLGFGGSGPSSTSKWAPPDYTVPGWQDLISRGETLAGNPANFTPYTGQTVANLSPMMANALQMQTDFTQQGSPERSATGATILNQAQGNMNPYATAMNPYMGDNPYVQNMLNNSNGLIAQNFAKGTAAQAAAAQAQQGAMGGSAAQEVNNDNNRILAGSIAANTNNLLGQQFNNSQQLAENALNRATGAYDQTQNRALQAGQLGLGQQGADLQSIAQMAQLGQIPQQYQQQLLNANQNLYQQFQQANITPLNLMQSILGSASTGFGQGTQIGPASSVPMGLLGGALAGYGLFH